VVKKTAWCWYKDRHRDQYTRIENPEINPCVYSLLILNRDTKTSFEEMTAFSINGAGKK
jgi:hypothetical protein